MIELKVSPCEKINPIRLNGRNTNSVELFCSYSKLSFELINFQIKEIEKRCPNVQIVHLKRKDEERVAY